jgi:hypothetical protein
MKINEKQLKNNFKNENKFKNNEEDEVYDDVI